ncbi:MAG: serine hydrolase [Gemmatimonadetes bacterium]|nr:serine hydrolase [Gemmatimonadota bacterium]
MPRLLLALLPAALLGAALRPAADPAPKAVDAIFAAYDHTNTPGCALGVYRDEKIIYSRGYGMADLNQGLAITPHTVFYLASMSKQFTAAAIALLAEQGKLGLDDPIRKYVPELPAWAEPITVRHLVHHTSGIRDYLGLWGMSGRSFADELPEEQALDLIARQRATDFPVGSRYSYSNSGYLLLTIIAKRAGGQTLRQFTTANIFAPLGMAATHFHDDNTEIVASRAEGYQPHAGGGFEIVRTSFALVGDGGLYSTVEDLLKWDANFYHNRLGSRGQALVDQLLTPGTLADGKKQEYAWGLVPGTYRGLQTVAHGGSFIGFRTALTRFPTEHLSVAVLCNDYTANPDAMALKVADLYLADRLSPVATTAGATPTTGVAVAAAKLDAMAGRYDLMPGLVFDFARQGDAFTARQLGTAQSMPLTARSDSTFESAAIPGQLIFHASPSGPMLEVSALGAERAPRLTIPPAPTAAELAPYAGRYTSEELDSWTVIAVRDGKLMARPRYGAWAPLEPVRKDAFVVSGAAAVFDRDKRGGVTGFGLSAARTRNVRFTRVSG